MNVMGDSAGKVFSELQDLVGPVVKTRIYTQICYCFPLPDTSLLPQIVQTLNRGLQRLYVDLPWVNGQVTLQPASPGRGARPIVTQTTSMSGVKVNDLTLPAEGSSRIPTFEQLRQRNFPFDMLDASLLTPSETRGTSYENNPATVLLVQLTVLHGGIILTVSGEHSQMDGQGVGQLTRLFSKSCRGEPLTPEEIFQSNQSRGDVVPVLDFATYQPGPELSHHIVKTKPDNLEMLLDGSLGCDWTYVHFSKSSLIRLRAAAMMTKPSEISYVTTDDALSALIWQSVLRARSARLAPNTTSTFVRAVDVRPYLGLPPNYLGNMTFQAYSKPSVPDSSTLTVGQLAGILRANLIAKDLVYGIRSLATYVAMHDDLDSINYGSEGIDASGDIWFSSWAKLPCREFDFGLGLGVPEKVRIPRLTPYESLMYLMPVDKEDGIDAAICLRAEDMKRLRADEEFLRWGEWVG